MFSAVYCGKSLDNLYSTFFASRIMDNRGRDECLEMFVVITVLSLRCQNASLTCKCKAGRFDILDHYI